MAFALLTAVWQILERRLRLAYGRCEKLAVKAVGCVAWR
jgi:hypothetical protein